METTFIITIYAAKNSFFNSLSNVDIMKVVEDDSCVNNSTNTTCFRLTSSLYYGANTVISEWGIFNPLQPRETHVFCILIA